MIDREKSIREEIEKTGDAGGDLHLELAQCLIAQEKYDEACENLLFCIDADTMVRDCAYPLIVDLLSKGQCIDVVPHMTFEWLRLDCYIEPEKKKAMYMGIAFGSDKLNKIATALECYIIDFGGDANVGAMYDRLEDLTYEQMPDVDYYDYYYYEQTIDALCEAVKNGLSLSDLSDYWPERIYFHTDSEIVAFECLKYIYESGKRELLQEREIFSTVTKDSEVIKNAIVRLLDFYISKKNYEVVAWIYNDLTCHDNAECTFDYDEVSEKIHARVLGFVIASQDVKTVSTFFKNAPESTYLAADDEQLKALCDFVIHHYFDENGTVRDEWEEVPDLIESVFTIANMENNNLNFDFNDGVLRVTIVGEINHHNAVFVRDAIDEKTRELCPQNLVIDLAEVSFMDSAGLGLFIGRYQLMKDLGGTLTIANPGAEHKKLIKLAGLNKLVKIVKK